jgi:hypothetical protein
MACMNTIDQMASSTACSDCIQHASAKIPFWIEQGETLGC